VAVARASASLPGHRKKSAKMHRSMTKFRSSLHGNMILRALMGPFLKCFLMGMADLFKMVMLLKLHWFFTAHMNGKWAVVSGESARKA
jgi:hypothetical protein